MSEAAVNVPNIADVVPHAGRMSLLTHIVSVDAESLHAQMRIGEHDLFLDAMGPGSGVGGWVGIEYMAQAVAAWAGAQQGEGKIGFLLGSRRYQCSRANFALAELLDIFVRREFQADNGLGQFECRIDIDGATVATASLTVFGPEDPQAFLRGEVNE
jgi:predicted hotdog family 3-hydroxylacyl-ACP dehydratase